MKAKKIDIISSPSCHLGISRRPIFSQLAFLSKLANHKPWFKTTKLEKMDHGASQPKMSISNEISWAKLDWFQSTLQFFVSAEQWQRKRLLTATWHTLSVRSKINCIETGRQKNDQYLPRLVLRTWKTRRKVTKRNWIESKKPRNSEGEECHKNFPTMTLLLKRGTELFSFYSHKRGILSPTYNLEIFAYCPYSFCAGCALQIFPLRTSSSWMWGHNVFAITPVYVAYLIYSYKEPIF